MFLPTVDFCASCLVRRMPVRSAEIPGPDFDRLRREVWNIDVAGLNPPRGRGAGIGAAAHVGFVAAAVRKTEGLIPLAYGGQQA